MLGIKSLKDSEFVQIFKKHNYLFVFFLCLLLGFSAITFCKYSLILYLGIVIFASCFYDINKMIPLCAFVCVFEMCFQFWAGSVLFFASFLIIYLKRCFIRREKFSQNLIIPVGIILYFFVIFFVVGFDMTRIKAIAQLPIILATLYLIFLMRDSLNIKFIVRNVSWLLVLSCVMTIPVELLGYHEFIFFFSDRYYYHGFLLSQNILASWCAILFVLQLCLYFKKKIGFDEFFAFSCLFLLIGLTTQSKQFLVLFLLILSVYFIKQFKNNWKSASLQLLILMVVVGIFVICFYDKFYSYISRFWIYLENGNFLDTITTGRVTIWKECFSLWTRDFSSFMLGYGGSYVLQNYSHAHCAFLDILIKYGFIGMLLVILLFVLCWKTLKNEKKFKFIEVLPVLALLFVMLIEILYDNRFVLAVIVFAYVCEIGESQFYKVRHKIPKVIHYIWFGKGKMSKLSVQYIEQWKKVLKGYQFKLWNENNFDINKAPQYVQDAYRNKKYAFVADYVRLYALYNEGGIYFDTDVQVIKPFDDQLLNCELFFGREDSVYLSTAIIGANKKNKVIYELLNKYNNLKFEIDGKLNLSTNVEYISKFMKDKFNYDFVNSYQEFNKIKILPREFFSPKNYFTNKTINSEQTYAIHHFEGSWNQSEVGSKKSFIKKILIKLPICISNFLFDEYRKLKFYFSKK